MANKEPQQKSKKDPTDLQGSIKEFEKQLKESKELAERRLVDLKYLYAEFDNFRKQMDKEKEHIINLANENLIKELMIILDDLEASLKSTKDEETRKGMEQIYNKFLQILEKKGLKKIEALGKKLDPNFHEVLCKELCEREDDEVIEEIQKGYTFCCKVIRPSKVKIAKKQGLNSEVKKD